MAPFPRLAILGFAHYHANFWTEAFQADGGGDVVCVWDHDRARGAEAAARFSIPFEPDLAAALGGCDAVAIASENARHAELTIAAAAAGRAILCEKPTARRVAEADSMRAALDAAGVPFMQSFPKRTDPASHALKAVVDSGRLGRIHLARIRHGHYYGWQADFRERWYVDPELGGGGALLDEGIHGADLLNWFFGPPESVSAETAGGFGGLAVEENASALFRYAGGMLAELTASFLMPAADVSIEIYGSRAAALLSGVDLASRDVTGAGFLRVSRDDGKGWETIDVTPRFKTGGFHHETARRFLHCLRSGEAPPAGIAEGRAALLLIESAYRAARLGRRQTIEPDS